jgi:hypothetical protein
MNSSRCTRRRFLSATLGLAGLSAVRFPLTEALSQGLKVAGGCGQSGWMDGGRPSVEGYAIQRSYLPGERVILCLSSTSRSRATVVIQRLGADEQSLRTALLSVEPKAIPIDASERGCGWEQREDGNLAFDIPMEWPCGLYRVTMSTQDRQRPGEAFFVIRSPTPGKTSRVLLVISSNTYFAYNNYGARTGSHGPTTNGSFYEGAQYASFLRPLPLGFISPYDCGKGEAPSRHQRYAGWDKWEWPFVQWAERERIVLEYATNEDLERYPELLSSYRLVLSVGHDEYWSHGMRDALERHIRSGGNVAFLSGNVCYRNVDIDVLASRLALVGTMDGDALWSHRHGPNRPENKLTGVSFCYGALNPDPVPYTIYQPHHWIFDGLWSSSLKPKRFPQVGRIGYECDGCDIDWVGGVPTASHRDGTPEGFEILGFAPGRMPEYEATVHSTALFGLNEGFTPWGKDLRQGGAVLGIWTQGGTVCTVGCTEWARHLGDPVIAHITRNIVRRLSS